MKCFKLIILFVVVFILSGCQKLVEPQVIEGNVQMFIEETYEINFPVGMNVDKIKWENNSQTVVYFESKTKIVGFSEGETVLIATDGTIKYNLSVVVWDSKKVNQEINDIVNEIRKRVKIVNDELILVQSLEGFDDFTIAYESTNPDVLSLDGAFERGLIDKHVNIIATLMYKNVVREFPIQVKIDMIPYEQQKNVVETFINERIMDLVTSESGKLPTYLDVYNLDITWRSSKPGIIDSNNNLHRAYEPMQVVLLAVYEIAGEEVIMEVKYNSKGISESEKEAYIERVLNDLIPIEAGRWVNTFYDDDIEIIQDFVYPDSVTQLRPGTGKKGVKMPGGPQYVVIHDTGMTGANDNAEGLNEFIHNNANTPEGRVASWHFSIDQEKAYQHVPTDEIAWHAGDGGAAFGTTYYNTTYKKQSIGGGNQNGIGIETCINPSNDYELTLKRTAKLTAQLLLQYNLGLDRIKQHYNFSGKNCPNVIRSTLGMWENFLKDCELQYFLLMIDKDYKASWENSHPQIIKRSGLVVKPISDTNVTLKLTLTLNGKTKTYEYKTLVKGLSTDEKLNRVFYDLYLYKVPRTVTSDIEFPIVNDDYQATIVWRSSKPEVLSNDGKYKKPNQPELVTLTLKITINGVELIKTMNVTVE